MFVGHLPPVRGPSIRCGTHANPVVHPAASRRRAAPIGCTRETPERPESGDTLRLDAGTFYDSTLIAKPLTIRGEGPGTVIMPPPTFNAANPCNTPADPTTHPPMPEQVEVSVLQVRSTRKATRC